jgi:hypothetical protein
MLVQAGLPASLQEEACMSCRRISALLFAMSAIGCAQLPYHLTFSRDTIVAVDVGLEPDAAPTAAGAGKSSYIPLGRGFVRSSDVHHLSAAVANVMATTRLEELNLKSTPLEASPALRRLEERMVEAFRLFALNPDTAEDFIVTPDGAEMSGDVISAVERYVPNSSGPNYRPQALVGPPSVEVATRLESRPAVGAAVYQLGRQGTAERRLWTWTGEAGARRP